MTPPETVQDALVGQLLDGRYRIEERLARGGMATVYTALDVRLDRRVAVKVLHPALAGDDHFVACFAREARAAARLSHPHVVAVHDVDVTAGGRHAPRSGHDAVVFLVMEYVEGRTLRDLLDARGPLSPREAIDLLQPVLAALGAAHRAGIVHRDVKPENVLIADDGRIKVADFGLARAVSSASGTQGLLIGTVAYLPPEQVERGAPGPAAGPERDGDVDPRADVYAAGILLFEMLTGAAPYDGSTALQVAYRHVHEDVPPPSRQVPTLPPALDALVVAATRRDRAARPRDANEFLAELMRARQLLSPSGSATADTAVVTRPGRTEILRRPAAAADGPGETRRPRWRRRVALVTVVALLGAVLWGGNWWLTAGPGSFTSVPGLLALPADLAEVRAAEAGLTVTYAGTEFSEQVDAQAVIRSVPPPGERIDKGGAVELVLSRGKERFRVPDLRGLTFGEARTALQHHSLVPGPTRESFNDAVPAGQLIATDPAPGTELKRGQAVTLLVSRGVAPVDVPDLTGRTGGEAVDELHRLGLQVSVSEEHADAVAPGLVIRQRPAPGVGPVPRGTTIALVLSRGPAPVAVPDVRDTALADARRALEAAGLTVETRGPTLFGRVVSSSPGPGELVARGSVVTLSTF